MSRKRTLDVKKHSSDLYIRIKNMTNNQLDSLQKTCSEIMEDDSSWWFAVMNAEVVLCAVNSELQIRKDKYNVVTQAQE